MIQTHNSLNITECGDAIRFILVEKNLPDITEKKLVQGYPVDI